MTSPITAIIFDFGNVLVKWDVHNLYKRFFPDLETVDSFLEEIRFTDWNACQDAGRPFDEGVAELTGRFPQYTELIQAYDTCWEESITEAVDETIGIAQSLKDAGWSLYLLSNFSAEKFILMKDRYNFLGIFDDLIISGEHKLVKPDPAIYELTLKRINRKARECLFIDDSLPNINTARSLGFHVIQYRFPEQLRADLGKLSIHGK
ncbi:MAG: HAD family phosphatase [Anaerolineales bacterium]|nr:MAG: HAD family phosphatase [Anaerolineales bacterium]